jgi:hypothetical protein
VYSTLLLWLLSELYERLPEVGDRDKPKLVFFFDEAHLLFTDAPKPLLEKIEQVVRLIRSKGVGVFFVTQNPLDVPDTVLGQLGNRVQHALRAFTPRDQKAVKAAAETMRANPKFSTEAAITELGVGEGLISFLDEKGRRRSSSARTCFRRRAASGHHAGGAQGVMAALAGGRRLRKGRRPRVGVRKAQGARGGSAPAGRGRRAARRSRRDDGRAQGHPARHHGPRGGIAKACSKRWRRARAAPRRRPSPPHSCAGCWARSSAEGKRR